MSQRDLTIQEAAREARKITGCLYSDITITYRGRYSCRYKIRITKPHESGYGLTFACEVEGRTLRSCLGKLKKEANREGS